MMYNRCREGSAIKINTIAGMIVQIVSIICPCSKSRWLYLLNRIDSRICPTMIVIIIRMSRVWSWKNDNCSISGDALSCNSRVFQVAISKKSLALFLGLKSNALFCHIRILRLQAILDIYVLRGENIEVIQLMKLYLGSKFFFVV